MRALLSADKSYCGSRMKNPFSTKHDTFVSGAEPYTLEQLADKLDLYTNEYWSEINAERAKPKLSIEALKRAEPSDGYLGRNHAIFENVRFIGYRNSHLTFNELYKLLLRECEQYNTEYYSNDPLQYNHLTHIARSITRFCKSERFGQYSEQSNAKFSKLQAFRANCANAKSQACNKGGRARSAKYDVKRTIANKMADQGYNNTQIALKLGVSRVSVIKWLK